MVQEAEEFAKADQDVKDTIESKNQLEALVYQTRSAIENPEMKSKLDEGDVAVLTELLNEVDTWLLTEGRSKSEYDNKMNEINGQIQPIMMKAYQQGTEGGSTNEAVPPMGSSDNSGPTIDEVD